VWSSANVAGIPLADYCRDAGLDFGAADRERIFVSTRDAAYEIIERKGATYYAVAAGLIRLVEAILRDQHTVLSVSGLMEGQLGLSDVYLSLPAVIGGEGIERTLTPSLSADEADGLRRSASILRASLDELDAIDD
jgi:L-lactate dehydrogenase